MARRMTAVLALALWAGVAWAQQHPPAPPADSLAAPGRPGWTVDARNGCWLWNSSPQAGVTVAWDGACPRGPAEGPGSGEWRWSENGQLRVARFEGIRREGRQNGPGVYIFANGNRYDGEYRGGQMHGRGVYTWANGDQYEGEYRDGRKNGQGVMTFAGGARYQGGYLDDQQHGRGVWAWPSGNRYEGELDRARANGYGEYYIAATRQWYRGTWVGGCYRGADGRRAAVGRALSECR